MFRQSGKLSDFAFAYQESGQPCNVRRNPPRQPGRGDQAAGNVGALKVHHRGCYREDDFDGNVRSRSRHEFLNRSGDNSVYRTVCWLLGWLR